MNVRFGQYLRMKGMTQRKLSSLSGIAVGTISRFLRGEPIGSDKLLKLISICDDLSLPWLFYGTGDMFRSNEGNTTINMGQYASADVVSRGGVQVKNSSGVTVGRGDSAYPEALIREKDSIILEKDRVISERDRTIRELLQKIR